MQKNPTVFILILNWNSYDDTLECIISLQKIKYQNHRIIIIDNGSKTNEIDNIKKKFNEIEIIHSDKNLGFSGGNNIGIEYSIKNGAELILLLNNDTIVEPDFLNHLINASNDNEKIGITVPKIKYYSNPDNIWYAGGYISNLKGSAYTIGEGESGEKYQINKFVTFATGCCMLIKKQVFEDVGYWDEDYFLYLEDADFCKRTTVAGFKILFVPGSKIFHKVNTATTKNNKNLPLYYMFRNRLYFSKKLLPNTFLIAYTYIFVTSFLKSLAWLLKGESEKIKIIKRSFSDFKLKNMGKREVQ